MSYTKADYRDGNERAEGMQFMREELDAENLGFTVVDCDSGWTGMEHDHADEGQEEVYFLERGEATVVVDGDAVEMSDGDALRISPDATRQIHNGDADSRFVLVGAP